MSRDSNSGSSTTPPEEELNRRIAFLSGIISTLEDTKRELDTKIATHSAHTADYKGLELQLLDILKEIELRKGICISTTEEMNNLITKKITLENEVGTLETAVNQRKEYVSDIEKLRGGVEILQKEMEDFQNQHFINKKQAEQDLLSVKKQIKDLHDSIGLVVNGS